MRRGAKVLGLVVGLLGLVLGLLWVLPPAAPEDVPAAVRAPPVEPSTWSAQALAAPSDAHGTGTLGGRVLGPEGPVPGALVVALAPPSEEWRAPGELPQKVMNQCPPDASRLLEWVEAHRHEARPLAHATTDAQGRFLLEGLTPGPFVLWAEKDLLIGLREGASSGPREQDVHVRSEERLSGEVRDEQRRPLGGVRVTVRVRAAGRLVEAFTGEDGRFELGPLPERGEPLLLSREGFLPVSLAPPGRKPGEGTLTLSASRRLSGQVLDERGPVPGATVQLESAPAWAAVTADERGLFEFEGVCTMTHVLVARQGEKIARQWAVVTSLREPAPVELILTPQVRLSGRVTDTSGHALAQVEVSASGGGEPGQTLQAKTDTRGRFLLESLVPGRYRVSALAPHYALTRMPTRLFTSSQEVEFELKPAEPVEGVVVDERGVPVKGVGMRLVGTRQDPEQPMTTSGAEGRFTLEASRIGDWRLATSHPDFRAASMTLSAPAREVRVVLRRGASLEAQVVDAAGQPVERAEVLLSGGQSLQGTTDAEGKAAFRNLASDTYTITTCSTDRGRGVSQQEPLTAPESRTVRLVLPESRGLSGHVVDARGAPAEGVLLSLTPDPRPPPGPCRSPVQARTRSDGGFSLSSLSEGSWVLQEPSNGLEWDVSASRGVESAEGRRVRVRISSDTSRLQLVLREETASQSPSGHRLRGRIVRKNGEPIARFQLDGESVDSPEGRFSQFLPWRGSPRRLLFEAPGSAPLARSVELSLETREVDLGDVVLEDAAAVTGRVVDALDSAPISRVLVRSVTRVSWSPARMTYTRPDGSFTLEDAPPDGTLVLSHPLYPSPQTVTVTRGQEVVARLVPGATLEGRVESDGVPAKVGTIQLYSTRGEIVALTELWQGRYTLESLLAGSYVVRVLGPRGQGPVLLFPLRTVQLTAGERRTLDFTGHVTGVSLEVLLPGRDIDVYLVPGELPLLGPRQGLYNKLTAGFMGKRVSEGARRFPQLPGGNYTLIAVRHDESGADVHREQVELPSEGELSLQLTPLWNRFED